MIKTLAAGTVFLLMGNATAGALDLKELMPCKNAAARLCDRSQGMTVEALWKCGATLATHRDEVGRGCLAVLRKHGQIDVMATAVADR
jgi:hypothetical protein